MLNPLQNRNYLIERHRLSHQQIDRFLGENRSKEFLPEKIKRLEAVRYFLAITDRFREKKIPFVCLKGPILSYRIYGDASVRISHDIDIFIHEKDIEAILQVLFENGYHFSQGFFWPKQKTQQQLLIKSIHHISLFNKTLKHFIEVHWILILKLPISHKKQKKIIANNLSEMDFANRKFKVLSKEFELLFLMIHGSGHGWNRLKWLMDIRDYPIDQINVSTFTQLAEQLKAKRIIRQTNSLLKEFFTFGLPFVADKHFSGYLIRYALHSINGEIKEKQTPGDYLKDLLYQCFIFPGVYYKWKVLKSFLFRHGDILEVDSSMKMVYYLYRPYSFIKRRILHA